MLFFLLMFNDIMDQFFEILNDILSLIAPKVNIAKKPKVPILGRYRFF